MKEHGTFVERQKNHSEGIKQIEKWKNKNKTG